MNALHPIRLQASLHETIWGGRQLERKGWKRLPLAEVAIGEAWETEISTVAQNEPYTGKTLGRLVEELTDDPRGVRFVICGSPKLSDVQVEVVFRFLPSGLMRIITAYVLEE